MMILLMSSFMFVIIQGLIEASTRCSVPLYLICPVEINRPYPFLPENESQFIQDCQIIGEYFECVIRYKQRCENDVEIENLQNLLPVIKKICNKESELHQIVVDSLPCLNSLLMTNEICPIPEERLIKAGMKGFHAVMDFQLNTEETGNNQCISLLFPLGCVTATLERKCGEDTGKAYAEVFHDAIKALRVCKDEIIDAFPAIVEAFVVEESATKEVVKSL